jgi:hypothetical protein
LCAFSSAQVLKSLFANETRNFHPYHRRFVVIGVGLLCAFRTGAGADKKSPNEQKAKPPQ